jgi:hypothetical protein
MEEFNRIPYESGQTKECTERMTDWENEPSLDDFRNDYNSAKPFHNELIEKLDKWSRVMDGGAIPKKAIGKSTYRSRLARTNSEWTYSNIEEPVLNANKIFNLEPRNYDSTESSKINEALLNYQWSTQINLVSLINNASRAFVDEGTCIIKQGWDCEYDEEIVKREVQIYEEDKSKIMAYIKENVQNNTLDASQAYALQQGELKIAIGSEVKEVTKINIYKNQPSYTVCDTDRVIIDPSCKGDISKAKFIIDIIDIDLSSLIKDEKKTILTEYSDGSIEEMTTGHYFNLDDVRRVVDKDIVEKTEGRENRIISEDFKFTDPARRQLTMYEYWGYMDITGTGKLECIVASWINNIMVRLEKNPYAHKELPFGVSYFMPVKNSTYGEPNAELLEVPQDEISKNKRAMSDITAKGAVGQEFLPKSLVTDPVQLANYREGRTVFYDDTGIDPSRMIFRRSVDNIPPVLFNMLDMHRNEAESLSGVITDTGYNNNAGGIQSTTGTKLEEDSSSQRIMGILRRFTDMLRDLGRKNIILNQEYITDGTVFRLTNKKFHRITDDELLGEFDCKVTIATPQKNNNMASKIMAMMNTTAASMKPELADLHYKKIASLWGQQDLVDSIDKLSEQPPSPIEQEMQQLQLENARLENKRIQIELYTSIKKMEEVDSKIAERDAKLDSTIGTAQSIAEVNLANVGKLTAQTELFNQELEYIESGLKRADEQMSKEFRHVADLEREEVRTARELQNIKEKEALNMSTDGRKEYSEDKLQKVKDSTLYTKQADGSQTPYETVKDSNNVEIPTKPIDDL